jgi:hypothetical protein
MPMMELPTHCDSCGQDTMLDWSRLERRPLSKLYSVEGFFCPFCRRWKPLFFTTRQLDENLRKLETMRPDHPSFYFHLLKAVKRAQEIQKRGRELDGSIRHTDMAST